MQNIKELEHKIDEIKYAVETKEMEKTGLINSLTDIKERLMINTVILSVILMFFGITIWADYNNTISYVFILVLTPIYYFLAAIYVVIFILKPLFKLYINSNLRSARQLAAKRRMNTISAKIEICDVEISILNANLSRYEEALEKEKWSLEKD